MGQNKSNPESRQKSTTVDRNSSVEGCSPLDSSLPNWVVFVTTGLIAARWLVPTESAAAGDTCLLVAAWLVLTLIWAGLCYRSGRSLNCDYLDVLLAVVCLGPWLSLASVHWSGGDLRSGWNCSWEWTGNFLAVYWLRQLWQQGQQRLLLSVITCFAISISLLGIYQTHVSFPAMRAEYLPLIENYRQLQQQVATSGDQPVSTDQLRERESQERLLFEYGIPVDPQALQMFEQRLNSSEPFGRFALANTLAGFLLVGWFLMCGELLEKWRKRIDRQVSATEWSAGGVCLLLLSYCLLLTKSRTAWVGLIGGIFLSGLLRVLAASQVGNQNRWRIPVKGVIAGGLLLLGLVAVGAGTGRLDIEVLTESNKSLQYRYQYWSATLILLKDFWLFGTGPGQFRSSYLAYKLPQSSEEILDPHNFLLESWCSGGLLVLLGLLILSVLIFKSLWRFINATDAGKQLQPVSAPILGRLLGVILAAFLWSGLLVSPAISSDLFSQSGLLLITVCVAWLMNKGQVFSQVSSAVASSSAVGLSIHLLGAGGYGMPGIFQLWMFLLIAWPAGDSSGLRKISLSALGVAVSCLCFLILGIVLVIRPHLAGMRAEANLYAARSFAQSDAVLKQWKKEDRWSAEPWLQAGNLYRRTMASVRNPAEVGRQAASEYAAATQKDPRHYFGYQQEAVVLEEVYQLLPGEHNLIERAYERQFQAYACYPSSPPIVLTLARIASQCPGKEAESRKYAQMAWNLHEINRISGHRDKELTPAELQELKGLLPSATL